MFGLKLLGEIHGIINQSKAFCPSTTELRFESKNDHGVGSGLVETGNLLPHLVAFQGGLVRVDNVDNLSKVRIIEKTPSLFSTQ